MAKKLIVANWKMNPESGEKAVEIFKLIQKRVRNFERAEIVICPPFLYLSLLISISLSGKFSSRFNFGAQNCFWEEKGAFTGEISAKMLKRAGARYVIIAHSERRKILGEDDKIASWKIKAALEESLTPIFCLGETAEEKKEGKIFQVLENQIKNGCAGLPENKIKKIVFAYEPLWAIGSGHVCSAEDALKAAVFIRQVVLKISPQLAVSSIRVLYGGSVNSQNAGNFLKIKEINGLLVGGASLDAKEFSAIVAAV